MSRRARAAGAAGAAGAALTAVVAGPAVAQGEPRFDLGPGVVVVAADPMFAGAGVSGTVRFDPQLRLAGVAAVGARDGKLASRGELGLEFVFDPRARGWSPHIGGGLAMTSGSRNGGYLLLYGGVERQPRGRSGWRIDVGVGGGARLMVAWVRRFGRRRRHRRPS